MQDPDAPIKLVFPPFVDPRSPYLAIPSLVAYLRENGIQVSSYDFNVGWFRDILTKEYIAEEIKDSPTKDYITTALADVIATFDNPIYFVDAKRYSWARNVVDLVLMLLSQKYHGWELALRNPTSADRSFFEADLMITSDEESPFDKFLERYVSEKLTPDCNTLIGISIANMSQVYCATKIAALAKRNGSRVIIGGASVTLMRSLLAQWKGFSDYFDGAIFFEGEKQLLRLCQNYLKSEDLFLGLENCIFKKEDGLSSVSKLDALDLNTLPTPDFSDFSLPEYFSPIPVLPLNSSKGCSWGRCTFCSIPTTSSAEGGYSRKRKVELIIEDILSLYERHNINHFFFVDENIEKSRLDEISESLIHLEIKCYWVAFTRFQREIDTASAKKWRQAGCLKLLMGLESAVPRVLKLMKKGTTLNIIDANLKALGSAQIALNLFCIVGYPTETVEEMNATLKFVSDRLHFLNIPGFSSSFSEFILDPWSPLGIDGTNNCAVAVSPEVITSTRKMFNSVVHDLISPMEMVGWEEHSLLMISMEAEMKIPEKYSSKGILALIDNSADRLYLHQALWLKIDTEREVKNHRILLFCIPNGKMLWCSRPVQDLLKGFDGTTTLKQFIESFQGHDKAQLLSTIKLLWKNGFLKDSYSPILDENLVDEEEPSVI